MEFQTHGRTLLSRNARLTRALQVAGVAVATGGLVLVASGAPAGVLAQSTGTAPAGLCTSGVHSAITPAESLTAADVAAKVNPAVVTVNNLQANPGVGGGSADVSGGQIPAVPGFPGLPSDGSTGSLPGGSVSGQQATAPGSGGGVSGPVAVGTGTGFIIDEQGHVLTNAHVVDGSDKLSVDLYDGTTVPATVVGADDLLDIAVIQLDLPAGVKLPGVAKIGDSSVVRPGDQVVAIGSALGEFTNTVTEGNINAVDRPLDGYGLDRLFQHDAEIWHGNSGGPLINMRGEVIGVNAAGIDDSPYGQSIAPASMGFAIESNAACDVATQLIDKGEVTWPYIGIEAQETADGTGVEVASVADNGPASSSGLKEGDVITAFDGKPLTARNSLMDQLFEKHPGDHVVLTVQRGGAEQTVDLTLGERPATTQ